MIIKNDMEFILMQRNTGGVSTTDHRRRETIRFCHDKMEILLQTFVSSDVGPLRSTRLTNCEFNAKIAEIDHPNLIGCRFRDEQFSKAIERGTIAFSKTNLKESPNDAYVTMGAINALISAAHNQLYALKV